MFSKKQRIERKEIEKILKNPNFLIQDQNFLIKGLNKKEKTAKFSIIISKKTIPSAVKRHFLKRRITEAIKKQKIENKDIIVLLKKNPQEKDFKNFDNLLNKCIIGK